MFMSIFDDLDNEIKAEEQLRIEYEVSLARRVKENEFGDKISKSDICAGIMFWAGVGVLLTCACARGCQEYKKHKAQNVEKAKVIQIQHQR